jgi:hypothetical protein
MCKFGNSDMFFKVKAEQSAESNRVWAMKSCQTEIVRSEFIITQVADLSMTFAQFETQNMADCYFKTPEETVCKNGLFILVYLTPLLSYYSTSR